MVQLSLVLPKPMSIHKLLFSRVLGKLSTFTCRAQDDSNTTCHIFTSVVTDPLNHSFGTTISNTKPLSSNATEVGLSSHCTIQGHIANYDVLGSIKVTFPWWIDNNNTPRETLQNSSQWSLKH